MKKRVLITKLPKFKGGGAFRTFGDQTPPQDNTVTPGKGFSDNRSTPEIKVNRTLKAVPRDQATLEAEKGETVVTSLNDDQLPEFYHISGKPHSRGGTPLNLPEHSFIFSRDNKMKIKNPDIQKYFGMSEKKSGYTPAEISKSFNVNKYREILADPTSDKLQRETAELMIKNYVNKLGALALAQESIKGFQEGIPSIAGPFMEKMGIDPMSLTGADQEQMGSPEMEMSMYGGTHFENGGPIGTHVKTTQPIFGSFIGDWAGTNGMIATGVVPMLTMMGNAINPAVTQEEIMNRTLAENISAQGMYGNRGWFLGDQTKQGLSEMDPTRTTPVQFGADYNMLTKYGGERPKLKQYKGGGSVTKDDIKLRKGERVMHIPGQGYVIVNRRGDIVGSIAMPESNVSGTNADPNKDRPLESDRPTRVQNIPKGAVKWDPNKEGYDASQIKEGDYVKKDDGRWYRVKGFKATPYEGRSLDQLDERLGPMREAYGRLEHKIKSSPDLQKALIKQYRDLIDKVPVKGLVSQADIDKAKGLSDEEIINNYLRAQEQVMMINAKNPGIGELDVKDSWDRGLDSSTGLPREYVKAAADLGIDPLSISQTVAFQTAYIGMQNLYKDERFKKDLQDFKPLTKTQIGSGDEGKGLAEGHATISDVDGWWGNTTTGQMQLYSPLKKELDYEDVPDVEDANYQHLPDVPPGEDLTVGPFPEDIRNLNYATWATFSRRKGEPALQSSMYYEANPQFTDFHLAAQRAESKAMKAITDNPFLSGQRYGAVASQLMDSESTLKAQEMANRFNTAIANQFNQANAAGRSQFSGIKGGYMKKYLDEVEMTNEMANRELIGDVGLMTAMKNNLTKDWRNINLTNSMSDDFAVNPNWDQRNIDSLIVKKFNPVPITPKDAAASVTANVKQTAVEIMNSDRRISPDKAFDIAMKLVTGQDATPQYPPAYPSVPGMTPAYPGYNNPNVGYIDPAAYGIPS